jgi:hypothetical protein
MHLAVSVCPQCHMISNHKVQRMNTTHVILNHLKKKNTVGPPDFIVLVRPGYVLIGFLFPTVYITVYIEVLFF